MGAVPRDLRVSLSRPAACARRASSSRRRGSRVRRLVALDCVNRAAEGLAFRNLADFPHKRCGALALLDGDVEPFGLQGNEGEAGQLLRQTLDADRHVGASLRDERGRFEPSCAFQVVALDHLGARLEGEQLLVEQHSRAASALSIDEPHAFAQKASPGGELFGVARLDDEPLPALEKANHHDGHSRARVRLDVAQGKAQFSSHAVRCELARLRKAVHGVLRDAEHFRNLFSGERVAVEHNPPLRLVSNRDNSTIGIKWRPR